MQFRSLYAVRPRFFQLKHGSIRGKALVHGIEISNGHEDNSVLIVNDEPDQLTLMGSLLRKAGYSVLTAEDGLEGLTLAAENDPISSSATSRCRE